VERVRRHRALLHLINLAAIWFAAGSALALNGIVFATAARRD